MNADEIYPESPEEIAEYEAMYKRQRERNEKEQKEGASQAPDIFYLSKIYSIRKQLQVFDILMHFNSTHEERLWMVGFLKYAGYSYEEVLEIIDQHCQWTDYDPKITQYQVTTIFKNHVPPGRTHLNSNGKRRPRKWDLSPVEVMRIKATRAAEVNRRLTAWMRERGVPVYEHPGEFDPSKLGGL